MCCLWFGVVRWMFSIIMWGGAIVRAPAASWVLPGNLNSLWLLKPLQGRIRPGMGHAAACRSNSTLVPYRKENGAVLRPNITARAKSQPYR